jgi:sulfate transport system substrate-binding protein
VKQLSLGAYSTPREAYGNSILPAFQRHAREQLHQAVEFRESYMGSGAQARAVARGFEADVVALSLEQDVEKLVTAELISPNWRVGPYGGMVSRSIVVIGVREGNPRGIHDWDDLARPGIEVLTPDARMSGGAKWNMAALYGAAVRGKTGAATATALLTSVLRNVKIMDRGARDSMLTFERGFGDAIITYENEIIVGRAKGQRYDYVVPTSTILIENPATVVDSYAEKHGLVVLARAFVDFLTDAEAQRAFAEHGLRPVVPAIFAEVADRFPAVPDLFTIADLGGWPAAEKTIFAQGAAYDQALADAHREP